MAIIRRKVRDHGFLVVDRRVTEDSRLSWAARGILIYLLAKPDNWEIVIENLKNQGDLKRDAINKRLNELIDAGYMKRYQPRSRNGQMRNRIYEVFETPYRDEERP